MNINFKHTAFSKYGSYLSINPGFWNQPMGEGFYLCTHTGRGRKGVRELFYFQVFQEGSPVHFNTYCTPALMQIQTDHGSAEICLDGQTGLRIRTHGITLSLISVPNAKILMEPRTDGAWVAHAKSCESRFLIHAVSGEINAETGWNLSEGRNRGINFSENKLHLQPDSELSLIECDSAPVIPPLTKFDHVVQQTTEHWKQWLNHMPQPTLPDWTSGFEEAAYINWSTVVAPRGLYNHPVMMMNKTCMDQVWSWDHCFNAMSCAKGRPELAWAQFMSIVDHQDDNGCLPDSVNQHMVSRTFTKPPIHGWAYQWCWDQNPEYFSDPQRLQITYQWMSQWSYWWLQHATWGDSCLPYYIHGNNSGWDNATIFDMATPTVSPDAAAYLAYQCQTLSKIAVILDKQHEARQWQACSSQIIETLVNTLWRGDHFVGQTVHGQDISCQSLITCMPIILGKRLPEEIQQALARNIESFLTDHGLATEHPDSKEFHTHAHAYWRSSVWPPPIMIVVSGLFQAGYKDLASRIIKNYCHATAACGFRENHDPLTGEGRSDYAFTWTASVSMILANLFGEIQ